MDERNSFLKKIDRIENLPTLPSIVMELDRMLQDYNTPMEKLTQIIEKDQAMVPKLLKLVNSAFFGLRSQISEVPRAIALLGFNTVRNAIVSVSIVESFKPNGKPTDFDIKFFWAHSIAVAVVSKHLSHEMHFRSPEAAFTGGLLHDIGKIVLALYFPDLFNNVRMSVKKNKLSFYDAEKSEIPVAHPQIGAYMAKKWSLPSFLVEIIQDHHEVTENSEAFDLLKIIYTADVIANFYNLGLEHEAGFSEIYPDTVDAMKEQIETASDWLPGVSEEIQSACGFFLNG